MFNLEGIKDELKMALGVLKEEITNQYKKKMRLDAVLKVYAAERANWKIKTDTTNYESHIVDEMHLFERCLRIADCAIKSVEGSK